MPLIPSNKRINILMASVFYTGVILRVIEFFFNRSLWCDEGLLSINFLHRDFAGLAHPLEEGQVAPLLFLWVEKLMMVIFGNSDLSLRIVPLIISIVCLYLFRKLSIKILGEGLACLFVFFIFSTSLYLLRYTLEVKQYQGDMLVALFFWLQLVSNTRFNKLKQAITLLIAGSIALWFSNVAVVVLFVSGLYIFWSELIATRKIPFLLVGVFLAWGISFGAYFFLFIKSNPTEAFMLDFWSKQFPPHQIFSKQAVIWVKDAYLNIAQSFIPFPVAYNMYVYLFLALLLAGIYSLIRKKRVFAYLVIAPLLLHFILSWLKKYPFVDKFVLYQYPGFFIAAGAGLQLAAGIVRNKVPPALNSALRYILLTPLVLLFVVDLVKRYPFELQEIKKSMAFIKKEIQPGQLVYVYNPCQTVFNFYKETGVANFTNIKYGNKYRNDIEKYKTDFSDVKGDVWLLFAHINRKEEAFIINYLQTRGTLKEKHISAGSDCFLFAIN